MFSPFPKIFTIVVALPLMLTFLVANCDHHKRGAVGQTARANSIMDGARIGNWGGEHISLEVTAQGGQVEYDCAHGTIDQKVVPDAEGRFDLRGTHVREHGGPVRKDEIADSHPARFVGEIKGDTMTLTVTEADTKELVGTFTLGYGQSPRLMKCR
jgi:hypothetical protein